MVSSNETSLGRQYISFDLDTKELKKYYPGENWHNAYEDIKKHMQANGFAWLQGSGYISTQVMSAAKAHNIVNNFIKNNLWINKCMHDCRVFNVEKTNDLNVLFDKSIDIPVHSRYQNENKNYKNQHLLELKKNGFQPSKDIVKKMQQLDTFSGKYVGLKEIRDIFKGEKSDISSECKKLAEDIGKNLREQETIHISYL